MAHFIIKILLAYKKRVLLNLCSVSIKKILVTEFINLEVLQNVNLIEICQHIEINNLVGTRF